VYLLSDGSSPLPWASIKVELRVVVGSHSGFQMSFQKRSNILILTLLPASFTVLDSYQLYYIQRI
jgi:hypothetical protein